MKVDFQKIKSSEWIEEYNSLSFQERLDFVKSLLAQPVPEDVREIMDIPELIFHVCEHFSNEKKHDDLLDLLEVLGEKNPTILGKDRFYADLYAVDIYLFKNEKESVKTWMASMIEDPAYSIDSLIPMINKLVYYGYDDLAEEISKQIFDLVVNSGLMPGAEEDFAYIIFTRKLQRLYEKHQNGIKIDVDEFTSEVNKYGFTDKEGLNQFVEILLKPGEDLKKLELADYKHSKSFFSNMLLTSFLKYAVNKNINFATGYDLWLGAWENFYHDDILERKDSSRMGNFFRLNEDKLEEYIGSRFGFLSNKKVYAFAVLWGLPYIYDFLRQNELIDKVDYDNALKYINYLEAELSEGIDDELWKYNFVHNWDKPEAVELKHFNEEKELFEKSFYEKNDIKKFLPKEYFELKKKKQIEIKNVRTVRRDGRKIRKNDPCPCGSGKKYKKCCGRNKF